MEVPAFVQIVLTAASASNLLPMPVNVAVNLALDHWREQNLDRMRKQVESRFKGIEMSMVARSDLDGEFFKGAVVKIVREAAETASDAKRDALANALGAYIAPETARWEDKDVLIRVLLQLTGIEIRVLTVIVRLEKEQVPSQEIAQALVMTTEATRATCAGLAQIGLVADPTFGGLAGQGDGYWTPTQLARRLISFSYCDRMVKN